MTENEISKIVVDAAIAVHRELGPGLLESVYEVVLTHELKGRSLSVQRQVPIHINYKGLRSDEGFRADIIVKKKGYFGIKIHRTDHTRSQKTNPNLFAFSRA